MTTYEPTRPWRCTHGLNIHTYCFDCEAIEIADGQRETAADAAQIALLEQAADEARLTLQVGPALIVYGQPSSN